MKKFSSTKIVFLTVLVLSLIWNVSVFAQGSISGTVKFEGTAPHSKTIRMEADPICLAIHKETVYAQTVLLGEGNTLGNVFVYIKDINNKKLYPTPSQVAVLDQKGCNYSPRVMGVMVGQKVKFLNPDGTLHNVHAMCKINPAFNTAMPNFRTEMEKTFEKSEFMFPIRCDVHPWMLAWMAVMPHPFFTVTKADGHFEIKGIPAGTYKIEAWHEKLGIRSATVTVTDAADQKLNFIFSAPK